MAEYAISGDIATLLGEDHVAGEPAALWVEASQPVILDGTTGRLGGKIRATINTDGTFTVPGLPESIGGTVPLYRLTVDSRSLRRAGTQNGYTTRWFPLTANRDLTWIVANYVDVVGITPEVAANVAAAAALGATNNTATASFITGAGATQTALDARIATQVPAASTTAQGRVELATTAETQTGTDTARAVTPAAGTATYVAQTKRPINLRDNTALDFTGASNSATALQAAITAAGIGATLEWGRPGVIRCDTGITLLEHQTLNGGGDYLGAGGTPAAALNFPTLTASQVAVTGGGNNLLRDILLRGPMTGANSTYGYKSASGAPRFHNVSFTGFAIGCALTDAFYSSFDSCEFARNKYGLVLTNAYNLGIVNTRFYCQYGPGDVSFGYGIDGGGRPLNIYGGAIEGYIEAIRMYAGHAVNLWGTYFETAGVNAWGIIADASQVAVTMKGCFIYLSDHNRFVSMTGATSAVIDASGNKFVCPTSSTTVPIAYNLPNTTAVKGSVGPDSWAEVAKVGTTHLNPVPSGIRYMAP